MSRKKMGNFSPDFTFEELADEYFQECKMKGIEEITVKGYKYHVRQFMKWYADETEEILLCTDLCQQIVDNYQMHLMQFYKPSTVNSYLFKVSPVIKFGVEKGKITEEIVFRHIKEQENLKEIYSKEELRALLVKPKTNSFTEFRTWVIINILISTGIRSTELRELKIGGVDLVNEILTLSHTKNKKPRSIPLTDTLVTILRQYLKIRGGTDEDFLFCNQFGEMMQRNTLQCSVAKHNRSRGVTKTSVHLFRHTFITMCVRKGVSPLILRRITGHTTTKMLDRYYQYDVADIVKMNNEFNPIAQFKKKEIISLKKPKLK
ncbi:MAG: site-specific integrase [Bacillota bacterium]|nr:site-specific integrase [Bacillota bacterium]